MHRSASWPWTTLTVSLANWCQNILPLPELIRKLSANPAILGLTGRGHLSKGAIADVTLVDLYCERTIRSSEFESKARNTPFEGFRGVGVVRFVINSGRVVYDGQIVRA